MEKIRNYLLYNRDVYDNILDDPKSEIGRFVSTSLLVLIIFFPILLIFESIGNNSTKYSVEIFYLDAFISSAFLLEYVYRFICVKEKFKFIISPSKIVDLLSFLPFFIGLVVVGKYLKILRLIRLFRILRLIKIIPLTDGFIKSLRNYSEEYRAILVLYIVILFLGSFFVYYLEKSIIGTPFTSIGNSLWWGIVTMSTVGYGDMSPISDGGKIIGSILIFLGPLILALFGAITIMVFMESSESENMLNKNTKLKECHRCRTFNPRYANYCMKCGEPYYVKVD
ncbi:MAG: ion transporter [Candidatus Gracilibacteria bacterium]|nr:ion transporter [Candidatus Gracilibacteria bacterium]